MTNIAFHVHGIPKAQQRPRAFARVVGGGKAVARVYDAGTAEAWKGDVIRCGAPHRPLSPLEQPLEIAITFFLPRPKRLLRKRDPDGPIWHTNAPDGDNLYKAVTDALKTDGWFRDDSQIVRHTVCKLYASKMGSPGARIEIRDVGGEELAGGGGSRYHENGQVSTGILTDGTQAT